MKTLGELKRTTGNDYPARGVLPLASELDGLAPGQRTFWEGVRQWMLGRGFADIIIGKFAPYLAQRFGDLRNVRFSHEALIVRDTTSYHLGPHTDSPSKVLSFLFYLPADASRPHLGTSMYLPRDPAFVCPGGPHYKFENFRLLRTLPYVPNALFGFMKTPNSFHGVEPIDEPDIRRDLLLYDIRGEAPQQKTNFTF
jgi:hypothetical protein